MFGEERGGVGWTPPMELTFFDGRFAYRRAVQSLAVCTDGTIVAAPKLVQLVQDGRHSARKQCSQARFQEGQRTLTLQRDIATDWCLGGEVHHLRPAEALRFYAVLLFQERGVLRDQQGVEIDLLGMGGTRLRGTIDARHGGRARVERAAVGTHDPVVALVQIEIAMNADRDLVTKGRVGRHLVVHDQPAGWLRFDIVGRAHQQDGFSQEGKLPGQGLLPDAARIFRERGVIAGAEGHAVHGGGLFPIRMLFLQHVLARASQQFGGRETDFSASRMRKIIGVLRVADRPGDIVDGGGDHGTAWRAALGAGQTFVERNRLFGDFTQEAKQTGLG